MDFISCGHLHPRVPPSSFTWIGQSYIVTHLDARISPNRFHQLTKTKLGLSRRLGDWWIVERLLVIVAGYDHWACEGFLCLPWQSTKGNSSGLRVTCRSSSCVGCVAPDCGLGVWCLLAREPPSEWIATTGTSLPTSKWTSEEKLLCLHCLLGILGILWLITYHSGISSLPLSCITLCIYLCVVLVVVVAS
jgi:hypothetical protein